ncbi:MAG: hypothetical protein ABIN74_13410 [Ferruginibacter sp.]
MKKILLASALFMFAIVGNVSAQNEQLTLNGTGSVKKEGSKNEIQIESFSWGATSATGAQTVVVPNRKGTLKFVKNGNKFTDVVFIDAAGKSHRMIPAQSGSNGAPSPSCKYPLPDACFATADKNIGMCMCKPTDLNSNSPYTVTLLLPAVQKVREAAHH